MKSTKTDIPLEFVIKKGDEIISVFDELASLRISVFRDFPYLYEGSIGYEKEYLSIYPKSERSFLFAAYDDGKMVGATTCIPLINETDEVRQPFEIAGLDTGRIFYFGESILLPEYRGMGIGHLFFDEREKHANSFEEYSMYCFCSVDRGDNHPQKPTDYRPNDAFWLKRGYKKETALQGFMNWPDIGETHSTPKKMIFWTKTFTKK